MASAGEERMAAMEALQEMLETVAGYRAKCEAAGFSPTAAEAMAVDFHRAMLTQWAVTSKG